MDYNKVQYSEFTPDRVGQWVFRGETVDEVMEMKRQAFGIIKPSVLTPSQTEVGQQYSQVPPVDDTMTVPCKGCGGTTTYRTGMSKATGKPWKAYFCNKQGSTCKPWFIK